MKIAIMQPYFFPYIGYFQLMNSVDEFVIYDNIEFTRKGWINRNRILVNGKDTFITLPLKKDSDYLDVNQRYLSEVWGQERKKMLNRIVEAYRKAVYFDKVYPLLEKIFLFEKTNLFDFILNSITTLKDHMDIPCSIAISSSLEIDHTLKSEKKVIEICKLYKADTYVNPIGGINLYSKSNFADNHINLNFIQSDDIKYSQFKNEFVPWLSIIDVLMFNSDEQIGEMLKKSTLI